MCRALCVERAQMSREGITQRRLLAAKVTAPGRGVFFTCRELARREGAGSSRSIGSQFNMIDPDSKSLSCSFTGGEGETALIKASGMQIAFAC
ncbi:hypothetical protein EYF80_049414 [Liparis tanakae]|uniref:Uncharacterized protein n=1 Tax=Liparis tanakae TaxID=230148 RepID=A0A4Z2FGS9_9TELE|nr:hypothetical protein EYF80_049414 [Liparis tanakae]